MNNDAVVQIGTIIITLIGTIFTLIVIPYIKSKTTVEQQKNIEFWVKFAVQAAEQIFNKPGLGGKKKQYVINFLKNIGIKITMEQLNVLIEAAVHEINKGKLLEEALTITGE
ncbi:phage holin, LLH family [Brassicibacter mesophilus]|uniref:phage holin, LLH family n=1 Tax=Brassicibacter mesophilus TaxID=745119 RepID=UPI003D24F78F